MRSRPLSRTFTGRAQVARAVKPGQFTGTGGRTSSTTKILDNAIIGYRKLNQIATAGT
jgi:hypothetical protein